MVLRMIGVAVLMLTLTSGVFAKLELGEKAPPLDIEIWMKRAGGRDPDMSKEGRVQVVLFWKPSQASASTDAFRKMVELQQSSPPDRLVVFAISGADEADVKRFGQGNPNSGKFAIGVDKKKKATRDWIDGADIEELPVAFIVGVDGKIRYFGTPLEPKFADVLSRVLRGRYNPKFAAHGDEKWDSARRARKIRNWSTAQKLYDEVIDLDRTAYSDVVLEKFELILVDMGQQDQAYAYVATMMQDYSADPHFLGDLARKIAADPKIPDASRRMDVALAAAQIMVATVADADKPDALATQALVHYRNKEVDKAVELQKAAWFAVEPVRKPHFKEVLDGYVATQQRQGAAAQGKSQGSNAGANPKQP